MEKCKVNGRWINTNMSVKDLIEQCGTDIKISFNNNETDFYRDFCITNSIAAEDMLRTIKETAKNQKITAIKLIRSCTNWELKEAKEFVEYLMLE